MAKFDITYNMSEILNTPGIWIEQELDTITMIWEKNRARYMVPFSKDVAVDINNGNTFVKDELDDFAHDNKYRWMLIYEFNEYLI